MTYSMDASRIQDYTLTKGTVAGRQVIAFGNMWKNACLQVLTCNGGAVDSFSLEGSLDGTHWFSIGTNVSAAAATLTAPGMLFHEKDMEMFLSILYTVNAAADATVRVRLYDSIQGRGF